MKAQKEGVGGKDYFLLRQPTEFTPGSSYNLPRKKETFRSEGALENLKNCYQDHFIINC